MFENTSAGQPSQRNLRRTIFKNTAAITLGNIALRGVNFAFSVFVIRNLGDDRYGRYTIVLGLVSLLTIVAELGVTQYVTREIARDHSKAEWMLGNLIFLRMLLALVGIIFITSAAVVLGYSRELIFGILLQTFGFLLSAVEAPLIAVLAANERLDYTTALMVLGQINFMVFSILFLRAGWGFISLIVASHLSLLPNIVLAGWVIKRYRLTTFSLRVNLRTWPSLIRSGLNFGMIQLALTIGFNLDTVILSKFQPAGVIGWYGVASRLIAIPMYTVSGFKDAIVPTLARAYVHEPGEVERWYYRTVKFVILFSLPCTVGGIAIAFPVFRFLYTPQFIPAAFLFQLLLCDLPFLMYLAFCGNMATIVGAEGAAARVYSLNAAANLVLNLYAIPRFGVVGASLVTVAVDLVSTLQFHYLLSRKLRLPNMTSILARTLLATGIMGLITTLVGQQNVIIMIVLGVLTYVILVPALRLLDSTEWALIARALSRVKAFWPAK